MKTSWETPLFDSSDPLICHSLTLRPSVWTVFWYWLQVMGNPYSWQQRDPNHATVDEVISEIQKAQDEMIFQGCLMIGEIKQLAVEVPPDWMLPCDGSEYLRADYPELMAVLDPAYYTDATHFRTPDRTLRFGVGGIALATQGGELEHTLTEGEMPAHVHTEQTLGLIESIVLGENIGFSIQEPITVNTGSTGGGAPHNNMPPYEGVHWYIIARYPTG